jgi:hypothetical protein
MTKKANIITGLSMLAILAIVVMFMVGNSKKMNGDYVADTGGSKIELQFKGKNVTEIEDGTQPLKGTYEIKDKKLKMKFDGYQFDANFGDDKNAFVIDSATGSKFMGMGFLLHGLEFKKVSD